MIKTEITIGITTFNNVSLVRSLLRTIRKFTPKKEFDFGIVINDDGSKLEFKEELQELVEHFKSDFNHIHWIDNKENQGITKAWNNLCRFYDSEYIILLNNDIMVTPFWLDSIIYFLKNNNCGACSLPTWYVPDKVMSNLSPSILENCEIQIIDPITKEFKRNQPIHYVEVNENRPGRVMCPAGMLFGFTRKMYEKNGGFDENMRSFYNEVEISTCWARDGFVSYALPFPHCYHIWSYTFKNNKEELKPSETMRKDREAYIKKFGGDISLTDPNNPHLRFMPLIPPNNLKWLSHDTKKITTEHGREKTIAFYKENVYQETEQDVVEAGKV